MSAPQTPRNSIRPLPTTPPPLVREKPSFLNPHVCFVAALTGETLAVTVRTILAVKRHVAILVDTMPDNVCLLDKHHGCIVDETRHSFAAEVLVYIHGGVRRIPFGA